LLDSKRSYDDVEVDVEIQLYNNYKPAEVNNVSLDKRIFGQFVRNSNPNLF